MSGEQFLKCVDNVSAKGITTEESQEAYTKWAATYETDFLNVGATFHVKITQVACDHFPEESRGDVRILDIGAGTGLVAKELKKHGFLHIDALEPSEAMANEAKKQELYKNYFSVFLSEKPTDIEADSYDAITGSGIYAVEAHVPCEALHEMIRLVKPGGFIILATRHHLIHDCETYTHMEPLMDKLEADGKWKKVSRHIWPRCYLDKEGIAWCYQVL